MNKNNWFTIYWLNGDKSHIFGETIDQAFTHAGYGGGAVAAIDWYDGRISDSHWYDKEKKVWEKYLDIEIKVADFLLMGIDDLSRIMDTHNTITVKFDNDDIVVFNRGWGSFYLNNQGCWINYLEISFGEYFKGTYGGDSDDEENSHHYMMANGQYFTPDNLPHALEAFIRRVKSSPFKTCSSDYCEPLEIIHAKQKVLYNT